MLNGLLKTMDRINITIDMWKSSQKIQYMIGICKKEKKEKKERVLDFVDVPPPHNGVVVYDVLYKCLQDWGIEGQVCSIFRGRCFLQ
ncbi:zinc finger BED domain-containing protein RICESLEEPER 2-like [Gossypium australe]|uniref:Zinc finger BED domain-containing protein RICESLEEPER 2-like n=1 Tax=Gossypium australe TaxID=47621 RepID=A0A5B6VD18_9ROSI|nr:zinc finger BED domain-containing protein RICESLEEPER 2-like [Gossypium australe]